MSSVGDEWDDRVVPIAAGRGQRERTDEPPLVLRPARLPDPATIPPRPWLYGTQLLRGFVTVLVAPGGTGKTSYAMAVGLCVAINRKLLGEHIFEQCNVVVLNLEDPLVELDRRLAALMIRHDVMRADAEGRIFLHSSEDRPITMSAVGEDGFTIIHPDEEALVAEIQAHELGLVVVDPYAESHSLEENSNPHMVKAAAAWRRIARRTGCAVILVHHVRKGAVTDIDAARGAKALTDSARVGLLMSPMSAEEGEQLGVAPEERSLHVRLDDAKANMAPKAAKARWFRLDRVELGNRAERYPNGDRVAAIVPWEPPSVWEKADSTALNRALDIIAAGPDGGGLFAPNRRGAKNTRWVGQVLMDELECTDAQAAEIVAAWLKSGLLVKDEYRERGHDKAGVRVVNAKRPT